MDERDNQDILELQGSAEQEQLNQPADAGLEMSADLEESFVLGYN
ncbi:MAG: hypothetical protein AAF541_20925 [Pseudomonadota bacterium]